MLGTKGLLQNTISTTFGSINKFSRALGDGLSTLSIDQKFTNKRMKMQKKHKNKLFQGVHSLGYGIKDGIKGVIIQPMQHFKQEGPIGLFKGTLKGLMGVFFKPITGVVDLGSGIAYSFKDLFQRESIC